MTTALRVGMYVLAGIGWLFMLCGLAVFVGRFIAAGNRAMPERKVQTQRYTVIWKENQYEDAAFTGEVEWLDENRCLITEGDDAVMVHRHNIKGMY